MRVDIEALRGRMKAKNMNVKAVAEAVGMDESTMYRKMNACGITFTVGEVYKIIDILEINKKDAEAIFFSQKLA